MPQGKGTYGSKVGRPRKKYQAGGQTGEKEAVLDAAMKGQELKSISLENIPTENAPDRTEMSPMGNEVGTGMYKEGGSILRYGKGSTEIRSKPRMPLSGCKKVTDPKKIEELGESGKFSPSFKSLHAYDKYQREKKKGKKK